MALIFADRVRDTTTTTGTGTITLADSAPTKFQKFGAVAGDGDLVPYTIEHRTADEWENGLGTYNTTGPTLARTVVLSSSNSGAAVDFSAGTKDVFLGKVAASESLLSVKMFGAKGDGTTDDTTAIQAAIDLIAANGGGVLYFPEGVYRAGNLDHKDKVIMRGAGMGATILKVPDGVDKQVLFNGDRSDSENTGVLEYAAIADMTVDGNKENAEGSTASSAVAYSGVSYFAAKNVIFQNATGYGLGLQAQPAATYKGAQTNIYLENCHFLNNGDGVGSDTYDGLDVKDCDTLTGLGCTAVGNSDRGFNIRGDRVNLLACTASGNGGGATTEVFGGFEIVGNTDPSTVGTGCRLIGCEATSNSGSGFVFANGHGSATQRVRVEMIGCAASGNEADGVTTSSASLVEIQITGGEIYSNAGHGVKLANATGKAYVGGGLIIRSNGGSGIYTDMERLRIGDIEATNNASYGIEEGSNGTRTIIGGATIVNSNTAGNFLWNSNGRRHIGRGLVDYALGSGSGGDIIASASTVTLPEGGDVFYITGTTTIDTISTSRVGRIVVIYFTGATTVTHGSGIMLATGTNRTTANGYALVLLSNGSNGWIEIASGSGIAVDGSKNVTGIADLTMTGNLNLRDATDPTITLDEGNSGTSHFKIIEASVSQTKIEKTSGSGIASIDINPKPADGTGDAFFRFFRETNTSGQAYFSIHYGDNTSGVACLLGGNVSSYVANKTGVNFGIGTSSPQTKCDIDDDSVRVRTSQTPASAAASGLTGEIAWDADYIYVCVATNTWKRAALSTW